MPLAPSTRPPVARRPGLAVAAAAGLLITACTTEKTVVREVPSAVPAAAAPGEIATFADPPTSVAPPSATAGPDADAASAPPGETVDCGLRLPCRWTSVDGGFSVTVTSADDIGPRDGLSIAFRIDTSHDTELTFGGGGETLDANGVRHVPIARALGDGNGNAPTGLVAGTRLEGRIDHAAPAGRTTLERLALAFGDNGLAREARFENVPLGPREAPIADCALALPCTWMSNDGRTSIELVSAGGLFDLRRLTVGFTVTTDTDSAVALSGGEAIGADGTTFVSRTHALGTTSGFEPLAASTVATIPRAGTVDFRRTATTPSALRSLRIELYPDAPVPRWDVVFSNVPLS